MKKHKQSFAAMWSLEGRITARIDIRWPLDTLRSQVRRTLYYTLMRNLTALLIDEMEAVSCEET